MNLSSILRTFDQFKAGHLQDRFFKHEAIVFLLSQLPKEFEVTTPGHSVKGKSINLVKWGNGKTKVMLWSQMHGDEATGTMTMFDLFNFLQGDDEIVKLLAANCELYFIPMVNPDGAEQFTRRNAQQIDINRDYLQGVSPEARILKQCREVIQPEFGFNLHDQNTLWSVSSSLQPATLSFLAPATDQALSVNVVRKNAMLVIADIFTHIHPLIPGHIGLFDDEFEPRAFGDNFQKSGTSTILIEAGGYKDDIEKQQIRSYYFAAMLSGLFSIASKNYSNQDLNNYFAIPKNNKQIFHILIHDLLIAGIRVSVGINYDENAVADGMQTSKTYHIQDIGDLSFCNAYQVFNAGSLSVKGEIIFNEEANFELLDGNQTILVFQNGKLS